MGLYFTEKPFDYSIIESYANLTGSSFDSKDSSLIFKISSLYLSTIRSLAIDKEGLIASEFRSSNAAERAMMSKAVER